MHCRPGVGNSKWKAGNDNESYTNKEDAQERGAMPNSLQGECARGLVDWELQKRQKKIPVFNKYMQSLHSIINRLLQ